MDKIKDRFNSLKTKFQKKSEDVEHDIYNV